MPQTYKRLGAIASSGVIGTADTLYSASATAGTSTVISTIVITNTAATSATYRIAINTGTSFPGTAAGYIAYGGSIAANDSIFLTIGAVVDPTNRHLLCSASANTVAFSAFGVENS